MYKLWLFGVVRGYSRLCRHSTEHMRVPSRVIARYLSKVVNITLPHLHLTHPLEWPCLSFTEIFSIWKLESLDYHVATDWHVWLLATVPRICQSKQSDSHIGHRERQRRHARVNWTGTCLLLLALTCYLIWTIYYSTIMKQNWRLQLWFISSCWYCWYS